MRTHSVDYRADRPDPRVLINRGFWVYGVPRLIPLCRLFGHKPVVDGTRGAGTSAPSRWVACDRCGIRTDPQGHLDPAEWNIGDHYPGPFTAVAPLRPEALKRLAARGVHTRQDKPGVWPAEPTTTVGGQIIIGRALTVGADFKIGNCGSEQVLAAHIGLGPLGALYLHTEDHGRWLQRRLNPTGYESRVFGLAIRNGSLAWEVWAPRSYDSTGSKWTRGSVKLDPRDRLFGRLHYAYEDVGGKRDGIVRMPHGDDHPVTLQLRRCAYGRTKQSFHSWTVDWECPGGIPTKPGGRGAESGIPIEVSDGGVKNGSWTTEATAAIALALSACRARHNYGAPEAA